jgi:hypothetical protein
MAKHDDDNRSNQLNPNNDAYASSRSHAADDDEDETGFSSRRPVSLDTALREAFAPYFEANAKAGSIRREKFKFDFVAFNGQAAFLEFTAVLPERTSRYRDCLDIAEHVFEKTGRELRAHFGCGIAFSQIRSGDSKVGLVGNFGVHYNPPLSDFGLSAQGRKDREDWVAVTRAALEQWKERIASSEAIPRENLGAISPTELRSAFWSR